MAGAQDSTAEQNGDIHDGCGSVPSRGRVLSV